MKPETREWVEKAEGDLRTARRERAAKDWPNFDASCFHAQQCAEKYLKAMLIESGRPFPKIHDLDALLHLAAPVHPDLDQLREGLQQLTDMAVEVRYPGLSADAEDADTAIGTAESLRHLARSALGME